MAVKPQGKLSHKTQQAIAALLEYPTIAEAAKACGVGERTLWRWLQRPDFQDQYKAAQRSIVDNAVGEMQAATSEAVATLRRNLRCGNPFAENTAAQVILAQSLKAVELGEMQERIEKLEALLSEYKKQAK